MITRGNEYQVHGALRVLSGEFGLRIGRDWYRARLLVLDLVDDGFSDEQFFVVAKQLVQVAYGVASNENVRNPQMFRARLNRTDYEKEKPFYPILGCAYILFLYRNS
jgi:hypothetical protein